ncbi:MAG: hypothetical protein KIS94_07765 [Chitinophagales bacterium]|nr:hypothetical protein [Chitinophagales bacterium]
MIEIGKIHLLDVIFGSKGNCRIDLRTVNNQIHRNVRYQGTSIQNVASFRQMNGRIVQLSWVDIVDYRIVSWDITVRNFLLICGYRW